METEGGRYKGEIRLEEDCDIEVLWRNKPGRKRWEREKSGRRRRRDKEDSQGMRETKTKDKGLTRKECDEGSRDQVGKTQREEEEEALRRGKNKCVFFSSRGDGGG